MEQITAKETALWQKIFNYARGSQTEKEFLLSVKDEFSISEFSETKEPDGYVLGTHFWKSKDDIIHREERNNAKPVYFSPVPVSEVGQVYQFIPVKSINMADLSPSKEFHVKLADGSEAVILKRFFTNKEVSHIPVEGEEMQKELWKIIYNACQDTSELNAQETADAVREYHLPKLNTLLSSLRSNEPERKGKIKCGYYSCHDEGTLIFNGCLYCRDHYDLMKVEREQCLSCEGLFDIEEMKGMNDNPPVWMCQKCYHNHTTK